MPVEVQIIGVPIACEGGVKDTWRDIAKWAAGQLKAHYGSSVEVQYFDLFDPTCPPIPPGSQLPLILISDEVLSSGGKISIPLIRKKLQELGL